MDEAEMKAQQEAIKQWAFRKMQKMEKKLLRFARIYFGEPMAIVYCRSGVKIVHRDGSESTIVAPET